MYFTDNIKDIKDAYKEIIWTLISCIVCYFIFLIASSRRLICDKFNFTSPS
jgi:hypothetical protein